MHLAEALSTAWLALWAGPDATYDVALDIPAAAPAVEHPTVVVEHGWSSGHIAPGFPDVMVASDWAPVTCASADGTLFVRYAQAATDIGVGAVPDHVHCSYGHLTLRIQLRRITWPSMTSDTTSDDHTLLPPVRR